MAGPADVGRQLRPLSTRAVWAGIGVVVALEALGELARVRRQLDHAVSMWWVGVVRRAERETHGAELAFLARWLRRI